MLGRGAFFLIHLLSFLLLNTKGDGAARACIAAFSWLVAAWWRAAVPLSHSLDLMRSGLAQGSDTVELSSRAVFVLPNFARIRHDSKISGGVEQFLLSTHRSYKINTLQRYIKNLIIPNLWTDFFSNNLLGLPENSPQQSRLQ